MNKKVRVTGTVNSISKKLVSYRIDLSNYRITRHNPASKSSSRYNTWEIILGILLDATTSKSFLQVCASLFTEQPKPNWKGGWIANHPDKTYLAVLGGLGRNFRIELFLIFCLCSSHQLCGRSRQSLSITSYLLLLHINIMWSFRSLSPGISVMRGLFLPWFVVTQVSSYPNSFWIS
jgi:hypothetical protein